MNGSNASPAKRLSVDFDDSVQAICKWDYAVGEASGNPAVHNFFSEVNLADPSDGD